jgi:hypothetical protein
MAAWVAAHAVTPEHRSKRRSVVEVRSQQMNNSFSPVVVATLKRPAVTEAQALQIVEDMRQRETLLGFDQHNSRSPYRMWMGRRIAKDVWQKK